MLEMLAIHRARVLMAATVAVAGFCSSEASASIAYQRMIGAWMDATSHIVLTFNQDRTVADATRDEQGRVLGPAGGEAADIYVHYGHGNVCAYKGAISDDGTHLLLIGRTALAGRRGCTSGLLTRAR